MHPKCALFFDSFGRDFGAFVFFFVFNYSLRLVKGHTVRLLQQHSGNKFDHKSRRCIFVVLCVGRDENKFYFILKERAKDKRWQNGTPLRNHGGAFGRFYVFHLNGEKRWQQIVRKACWHKNSVLEVHTMASQRHHAIDSHYLSNLGWIRIYMKYGRWCYPLYACICLMRSCVMCDQNIQQMVVYIQLFNFFATWKKGKHSWHTTNQMIKGLGYCLQYRFADVISRQNAKRIGETHRFFWGRGGGWEAIKNEIEHEHEMSIIIYLFSKLSLKFTFCILSTNEFSAKNSLTVCKNQSWKIQKLCHTLILLPLLEETEN